MFLSIILNHVFFSEEDKNFLIQLEIKYPNFKMIRENLIKTAKETCTLATTSKEERVNLLKIIYLVYFYYVNQCYINKQSQEKNDLIQSVTKLEEEKNNLIKINQQLTHRLKISNKNILVKNKIINHNFAIYKKTISNYNKKLKDLQSDMLNRSFFL